MFDIGNLTETVAAAFRGNDMNTWKLGTGAFVIHGDAYARWFMATTAGDQSKALTALAWTGGACRQRIETDCEITLAFFGANTYLNARLSQIMATGTYNANAGYSPSISRQVNIWGETFIAFMPVTGLGQCRLDCGPRAEIDGKADESADYQDDLVDFIDGGVLDHTMAQGPHGLAVSQTAETLTLNSNTGFSVMEYVDQGAASAMVKEVDGDGVTLYVIPVAGNIVPGSITGRTSGETATVSSTTGPLYRCPTGFRQTGTLYIHDSFAEGLIANNSTPFAYEFEHLVIGNSVIDHWVYADNCPNLTIRNLGLYGYARGGGVTFSGGTFPNIYLAGALAAHPLYSAPGPLAGLETGDLVFVRADTGFMLRLGLNLRGDFRQLAANGSDRNIVWLVNSAGNVVIENSYVEYTGDDELATFNFVGCHQNATYVSVNSTVFSNLPVMRFLTAAGTVSQLTIGRDVFLQKSAGATTTAGALIVVTGGLNQAQIGLQQRASRTGYHSLLSVGGNAVDVLLDSVTCVSTNNGQQLVSITGTSTNARIVNSRVRAALPTSGTTSMLRKLRMDGVQFILSSGNGEFAYSPKDVRAKGATTVGALPAAATAGEGERYFVSNANGTGASAPPAVGTTVAAAGSFPFTVEVVSDGTNWLVAG